MLMMVTMIMVVVVVVLVMADTALSESTRRRAMLPAERSHNYVEH